MNYQSTPSSTPVRVIIINPLMTAGKILAMKFLGGQILGKFQMIDLILFGYPQELEDLEALKIELEACAYNCYNLIEIKTVYPKVTDADIFCFLTNLPNPHFIDYQEAYSKYKYLEDKDCEKINDSLFLLIKIAKELDWADFIAAENPLMLLPPKPSKQGKKPVAVKKKAPAEPKKLNRPIFISEGLIVMDIIRSFSTDIPSDLFFSATSLTTIGKTVLAEHLKVECGLINNILIWGSSDVYFHVEVDKPFVKVKEEEDKKDCNVNNTPPPLSVPANLDHTEFSATWLKQDYIKKMAVFSRTNPHGDVSKAFEIMKKLRKIWKARINVDEKGDGAEVYVNMGVISDGSIGTIKGYPYLLPIILKGDKWRVNTRYSGDSHLIHEIKRINKKAHKIKNHHMPFCNTFYVEHVDREDKPPSHNPSFYIIDPLIPKSNICGV